MTIQLAPDTPVMIYITCPDSETAEAIAKALVNAFEAACVNIVPGLRSVYRWQGAVEIDAETLLLVKTRHARLAEVRVRVAELHPDEVPEIVAVPIADGAPAYLEWLVEQTRA